MKKRSLCLMAFLCWLPSLSDGQGVTGQELMGYVRRIEGKPPHERRAFIKDQLKKWKVRVQTMQFRTTSISRDSMVNGENMIVPLGKGKKKIVLGAHYDAVPGSPGANDNGGGVAVLLGFIRANADYPWNYKIDVCFFDQEEIGLLGSREYVKKYKDRDNHLAMINLDVEGTGEEVYVGPIGGGDDDLLMPFVRQAAKRTGFPLIDREVYPPSDHLSFATARLENISVSVVPKGDADKLVALLTGKQVDAGNFPVVMKVMHTPHDSSKYMTPKALQTSYEFTRTLLTILNESRK